jgi:hypothetical protein
MSRSYRKYLSFQTDEFEPPEWGGLRNKERRCISDELRSAENGDVLFPLYYGSRKRSWYCSSRLYYSKKDIRTSFFTDIRNIINGYVKDRYSWRPYDHESEFIANFNNIKSPQDDFRMSLDWLDTKEAKKLIKAWKGNSLDVLYELTRKGIIERAVRLECKKMLRIGSRL